MATPSDTLSDDPDTSTVTMSIIDYPSSPGIVRHRRQVTWTTATEDQQSHTSCDLDLQTDDDQVVSVDELDTSPSTARRRREQRRRRRRRRQRERVDEGQLTASNDESSSASVSTQLLRPSDYCGDQELASLVIIAAAIGGTSVQKGDLSFQVGVVDLLNDVIVGHRLRICTARVLHETLCILFISYNRIYYNII